MSEQELQALRVRIDALDEKILVHFKPGLFVPALLAGVYLDILCSGVSLSSGSAGPVGSSHFYSPFLQQGRPHMRPAIHFPN